MTADRTAEITNPTDDNPQASSQSMPIATRHEWQRSLGKRYDGLHALLVRMVHPLAYGSFLLSSITVVGVIVSLVLENAAGDMVGVALAAILGIALAIIAAFTFVLTSARAILGLILLAGWGLSITFIPNIATEFYWAIWGVAAVSVALQLILLMWVVPRRIRNGLLHLLVSAAVGTILGAVPVAIAIFSLIENESDLASTIAKFTYLATSAALLLVWILFLTVRQGETSVLKEFASAQNLKDITPIESVDTEPLLALLPKFAWRSGAWKGTLGDRQAAITSGFTASLSPDVPSIYVTLIGISLTTSGPAIWVRKREQASDNVLVNGAHTRVIEMESIELDERFNLRIDTQTSDLDAWRTFNVKMLVLVEKLGEAQICRMNNVLFAWIVGGVCSSTELDTLNSTLLELATLLESIDTSITRSPDMTG